jgi:hypothetical protein
LSHEGAQERVQHSARPLPWIAEHPCTLQVRCELEDQTDMSILQGKVNNSKYKREYGLTSCDVHNARSEDIVAEEHRRTTETIAIRIKRY